MRPGQSAGPPVLVLTSAQGSAANSKLHPAQMPAIHRTRIPVRMSGPAVLSVRRPSLIRRNPRQVQVVSRPASGPEPPSTHSVVQRMSTTVTTRRPTPRTTYSQRIDATYTDD